MKEKYQIDITEIQKWLQDINPNINASSYDYCKLGDDYSLKHLKEVFDSYNDTQILNGEAIKEIFFPTKFKDIFKIFISHSGVDKEIVKKFANKIANIYNQPCFVDWMVWDNIETLQKIIDEKFCVSRRDEKGNVLTYNYNYRNYTTAHTHAMLSMALLDMIDQCDICIFIKSPNSTLPKANFGDITTLSPWIYEEVSYMNHIEKTRQLFSEGVGQTPNISHPLDLRGFKVLTADKLSTLLHGDTFRFIDK